MGDPRNGHVRYDSRNTLCEFSAARLRTVTGLKHFTISRPYDKLPVVFCNVTPCNVRTPQFFLRVHLPALSSSAGVSRRIHSQPVFVHVPPKLVAQPMRRMSMCSSLAESSIGLHPQVESKSGSVTVLQFDNVWLVTYTEYRRQDSIT